ncbi:uncharacterized protein METZ01_LOCUS281685, partial [marine metagenome]
MLTGLGCGRFEKAGAYVRAKRVGPFVFVAGTTAIEPVSTTVEARLTTPGMIVEIEIDANFIMAKTAWRWMTTEYHWWNRFCH